MKISPLKDRVLVKVKESSTKTAGGIYIPDTVKDEKLLEGVVIAVGKLENVSLNIGDRVIFESYAGSELKIEGEKHLIIDVKNTVTNPSITVESLTSNPLSTAATAAKVYQYLQLRKGNIADSDASKITINFRVPKSWLTSNGVAETDIVLYRYSESTWNALPTTKTGDDANNVLYQSTTPGFSTFAIGTKEAAPAVPAPEAPPAEVPAEAPAEVPVTPEVPAAPEAMEKKPLSNTALAWIVVGIIVIVAATGYLMMQRRKTG